MPRIAKIDSNGTGRLLLATLPWGAVLAISALALFPARAQGQASGEKKEDPNDRVPTIVSPPLILPKPEPPVAKSFQERLPGIDMNLMTSDERKKLLEFVNKQKCTCGCKDDSLAWCLNNDKGCPFALPLVTLAAADISPNFKKSVPASDLVNWRKYIDPPEALKLSFDYLKGFDLDKFSAGQKQLILLKANTLACTCGCKHETVAKCNNVDPVCQVAPAEIRKIIDETLTSSPLPPAAPVEGPK